MPNITVHLGSTTPFFLPGPAHARPHATCTPLSRSRCPTGPARQCHRRPALLPRPTRQPHPFPSVRPAARAWCTLHVPSGFGPLLARCRSIVCRDPPCSCRFLHASAASPEARADSSLRCPPLKRAPRCPPTEFISPACHLSHSSTPEHHTRFPTDPASASPAFCCRSPSSAPDSVRASPPSPISGDAI
jgi:hypothetical protein